MPFKSLCRFVALATLTFESLAHATIEDPAAETIKDVRNSKLKKNYTKSGMDLLSILLMAIFRMIFDTIDILITLLASRYGTYVGLFVCSETVSSTMPSLFII